MHDDFSETYGLLSTERHTSQDNLRKRVSHDSHSVFRRLGVSTVDNTLVEQCIISLKAHQAKTISTFKAFADEASLRPVEDLELEEEHDCHYYGSKPAMSGNLGSAEEKQMYEPLETILSYIAQLGSPAAPRHIKMTSHVLKPNEPHALGFRSCSPDFTIFAHGTDSSSPSSWSNREAFIELKASYQQGPKASDAAGPTCPIVSQCADAARILMSARPFLHFCVGVLVFGTQFCVGIFDRDGATLSPVHDMFADINIFVRVVRCLMCDMSAVELGLDPSCCVLSHRETEILTGSAQEYPSTIVSSWGNDPRHWCTIGLPLWISPSLLGRGTNCWRVREYVPAEKNQYATLKGAEMIMKIAWRRSEMMAESDIYLSIPHPPKGLAEFECGGDVISNGFPVSIQNLRGYPVRKSLSTGDGTSVLHRLVLRTIGKPLWEYTTDLELLVGFRDAVQAHKDLCSSGILHRDISPGNVMLTRSANPNDARGFIADLEFASIQDSPLTSVNISNKLLYQVSHRILQSSTCDPTDFVYRGLSMTGTLQFISRRLLKVYRTAVPVVDHQVADDVESFVWVLSYSVMRNIYHHACNSEDIEVQKCAPWLLEAFKSAFGQSTAMMVVAHRGSSGTALTFPSAPESMHIRHKLLSRALIKIFSDLKTMIWNIEGNEYAATPLYPPLTHDALLAVVDKAIATLNIINTADT